MPMSCSSSVVCSLEMLILGQNTHPLLTTVIMKLALLWESRQKIRIII